MQRLLGLKRKAYDPSGSGFDALMRHVPNGGKILSPNKPKSQPRRYDWLNQQDLVNDGKDDKKTFWNREQMPEEAGGGYDQTNTFDPKTDRTMSGPVA